MCSVEEHVAALGASVNLLENEAEAVNLFRLQGGIKRLRPLLMMTDELRPALAASVLMHCAGTNLETKVAMRVQDTIKPLVELLSSQVPRQRTLRTGNHCDHRAL